MSKFFDLKRTNIMVEFRVTGDNFEPSIVTSNLAITPSEHWINGEAINGRDISRTYTCWTLSTGYLESLDISEPLDILLQKLSGKRDKLLMLKKLLNINYKFEVVINIEEGQTPAIYLKSHAIEFAHSIRAEFDFDLYVYS